MTVYDVLAAIKKIKTFLKKFLLFFKKVVFFFEKFLNIKKTLFGHEDITYVRIRLYVHIYNPAHTYV